MAKCYQCQGTILFGGEQFQGQRFCSESCIEFYKCDMVDRHVPPQVINQYVYEVFQGPCPVCRTAGPKDVYSATRISAYFIMFSSETLKQLCCASCGRKHRLNAVLHCLWRGWWGPRAFFVNMVMIPWNLIASLMIRTPDLPPPEVVKIAKSILADELIAQQHTAYQPEPQHGENPHSGWPQQNQQSSGWNPTY